MRSGVFAALLRSKAVFVGIKKSCTPELGPVMGPWDTREFSGYGRHRSFGMSVRPL